MDNARSAGLTNRAHPVGDSNHQRVHQASRFACQAGSYTGSHIGRLELGLGPGFYEREYKWLGIPFLSPGGRAEHADVWLTLGKHGASLEESALAVRERNQLLDEYCAASGREPETIERAYFAGIADEFPFVSPDAFQEFVGRYREAGIERFLIWFASAGQFEKGVAAGRYADRNVLDAFAAEAMDAMQGTSRSL